jgi:hypothetical protein
LLHGKCRSWDEQLLRFTEKCRLVRTLFLCSIAVSDDCLDNALRNCSDLTHLTMSSMTCSLPKGMVFPLLVYVYICSCSGVSAIYTRHVSEVADPTCVSTGSVGKSCNECGSACITRALPAATETDVEYADYISHELRMELVKRCDFTRFHMAGIWRGLDNSCLQEILRLSGRLTSLHVKSCEWLQDATLLVCAQHCPLLADLTLTAASR